MGDLASTAFSSWCHRYFLQLPFQIRGLSLLPDLRPFPCARVQLTYGHAVHHDGTTIPLATGKAQAGETNL
jgi:hypothetical protein